MKVIDSLGDAHLDCRLVGDHEPKYSDRIVDLVDVLDNNGMQCLYECQLRCSYSRVLGEQPHDGVPLQFFPDGFLSTSPRTYNVVVVEV